MVVSAQWELVLGNSYGYTVLAAFGLFYAGFGAILTPFFGVEASYNGDTASYYNALGFWVLCKSCASHVFHKRSVADHDMTVWAVWNIFFLIGALPLLVLCKKSTSLCLPSVQQSRLHCHLLYCTNSLYLGLCVLLCACRRKC